MNCPRCNGPASEETLREFGGVCPKCLLAFSEEKDAPAFPSLEIVEMIGQGGMGVVYKAVQKSLGRTVALKVLSPQLSTDPEFVERFTREAKALAQLNHPNIVAIYDSGIHDKVPYLVMEFVEGKSLRQLLAAKELTAPQALELVPQICDALYYAHAKGVVHRDIKPENILLDAAGRVKIADYGLAKIASLDQPRITKSNVAMGTPHYMAPEQIERTGEVDHRADIYSLGVVIYEMLTGELPLGRFKPPSERAEIDRRLDRVVLKSLEKEPADRYQSANEVKAQIARLDQAPPPAAPPATPRYSKITIASGLLCIAAAVNFALTILFASMFKNVATAVFACITGGLLLATIAISIAGVFAVLGSHGALKGAWISVASFFFSGFMLIFGLFGMLMAGGSSAPAPAAIQQTAAVSAREHSSHLVMEWPEPYAVPPGFRLEETLVGEEAHRRVGMPGFASDFDLIQYGRFVPGNSILVFIRFKSREQRERMKKEVCFRKGEDQWMKSWDSGDTEYWMQNRGDWNMLDHRLDTIWRGIYIDNREIPPEEREAWAKRWGK